MHSNSILKSLLIEGRAIEGQHISQNLKLQAPLINFLTCQANDLIDLVLNHHDITKLHLQLEFAKIIGFVIRNYVQLIDKIQLVFLLEIDHDLFGEGWTRHYFSHEAILLHLPKLELEILQTESQRIEGYCLCSRNR